MTDSRLYPAALLAASLTALAGAYVAQFGFGLQPCVLCLYQRVPYAVAAGLMLPALLPALSGRARALLLGLAGAALLINAGIASYHVGVEQHWWAGTSACTGGGEIGAISIEDLQRAMTRPAEARCDEPAWSFHGITFAVLNVPFALVLAGLGLWAARRLWKGKARR